ncbi:twin-arginine translocation signal domain-containing protein, partial [Eggerthella sinensis]|uniref:twin-arginine translocation signal domain-containing protein n=1 Tax=Eggerthella sinensis TaxID=242230 RepID=UPI0022E292C5
MEQKELLSRRSFIKASSVAALGAAALGLAGCGPKPAQKRRERYGGLRRRHLLGRRVRRRG